MPMVLRGAASWLVALATVATAADYLPLKEGNEWTYTLSSGAQMTSRCVGFADVGGFRCGILSTTTAGQTTREYLAADSQGLKTYMSQAMGQESRYDPPLLRVKLPYQEGDTWTATVNQFGMSLATQFQSAGRDQVQAAGTSFECVKVRSSMTMPGQGEVTSVIYYAEGVGPVLQVMQAAGQQMVATLLSTNVRPVQEPKAAPASAEVGKIRCPKCGAMADAGAKFCPQCGAPLTPPAAPTNCPKCSAKLPAGARFCPVCGEKIAPPAASEPAQQAAPRGDRACAREVPIP